MPITASPVSAHRHTGDFPALLPIVGMYMGISRVYNRRAKNKQVDAMMSLILIGTSVRAKCQVTSMP